MRSCSFSPLLRTAALRHMRPRASQIRGADCSIRGANQLVTTGVLTSGSWAGFHPSSPSRPQIEEYTRKIRELGALPAEAHALHTGASLKQLTQSLEKCVAGLGGVPFCAAVASRCARVAAALLAPLPAGLLLRSSGGCSGMRLRPFPSPDWSPAKPRAPALNPALLLPLLPSSLRVRTSLKKFGTVNKRARDQLQQFTEQRDIIRRKLGEVEKSRSAILDMMSTLEGRKDELLERTFKQARRKFSC